MLAAERFNERPDFVTARFQGSWQTSFAKVALERGIQDFRSATMISLSKGIGPGNRQGNAKNLIIRQQMHDWTGRPRRRRITGTHKASQ